MTWLAIAGIAIFFVGLLVSIGLHEIGHLVPAKLFKVRVSQWMVGFGPTLWSRHRRETEYGIKLIPFGGYTRMIGMLPPAKGADPGQLRQTSTGPIHGMVEGARGMALEEIGPGDHDRVFYRKPWWQKVIVMVGGPAMNFVLAALLFAVVLMGFGVATPQPVVAVVSDCVISAQQDRQSCEADDPAAPAAAAGLRPGDRVLSFGGEPIGTWNELSRRIREAPPGPVAVVIERDGQQRTLTADLISTTSRSLDDPDRLEQVSFLGVGPEYALVPQGPGAVASQVWEFTALTAGALARIPQKMVGVWDAAFGGGERELDSPIGVVGASRLGGDIATAEAPAKNRIAQFIGLLASFNLALGLFNLIPLLPLDGGHIAGALWEGMRRFLARILRRPDPGYVDVAKALPLAYAMATVFIVMGVLLVYADLVNPVRLPG